MKSNSWTYVGMVLLVLLGFLSSCGETPIPKPKGYFRIALADKNPSTYEGPCPMRFQKPAYSEVELRKNERDSCWLNLHFPRYKAVLHMSYLSVGNNFDQLMSDSYQFVYEHDSKASAIDRQRVDAKNGASSGLLYDLKGEVATPLQFYTTDSTQHFLRGSLYFNTRPNPDSIRPVLNYLREDVEALMQSIEWK